MKCRSFLNWLAAYALLASAAIAEQKVHIPLAPVIAGEKTNGIVLGVHRYDHGLAEIGTVSTDNQAAYLQPVKGLYAALKQKDGVEKLRPFFSSRVKDEDLTSFIMPSPLFKDPAPTDAILVGSAYRYQSEWIVFTYVRNQAGPDKTEALHVLIVKQEDEGFKIQTPTVINDPGVLEIIAAETALRAGLRPMKSAPELPFQFSLPSDGKEKGQYDLTVSFSGQITKKPVTLLPDSSPVMAFLKRAREIYASGTVEQIAQLWLDGTDPEMSERLLVAENLGIDHFLDSERRRIGSEKLELLLHTGTSERAFFFLRSANSKLFVLAARRTPDGYRFTEGTAVTGLTDANLDSIILGVLRSDACLRTVKTVCGY